MIARQAARYKNGVSSCILTEFPIGQAWEGENGSPLSWVAPASIGPSH